MDKVLEKIYKSGLKFLVPLKPEETYSLIVNEAIKLVKADYGSILLEQKGELKRVYSSLSSIYQIKPRRRGFLYNVFKTRKPIILALKEIARIHPAIRKIGVSSDIAVPLSYKNKSIGVLTIMSKKENFFMERDMSILKLFAQLASLAIRKTQLYDETKKALDTRDLFISMAAHELRTPLTTINGYIQLLYAKLAKRNTPESRWVEELSWEGLRLAFLVNELLEVERIKTGQLQYFWKECSLREIVNRSLIGFSFNHSDHPVKFYDQLGKSSDLVIGDFDKLLQVITNLLDNAAKFSPVNTKVTMILSQKKGEFILKIKDLGNGISKKDLPGVFERFFRGEGQSKEGMGLGLFLAKNIITQHRGFIKISSRENNGTIVEVKLPKIKHD